MNVLDHLDDLRAAQDATARVLPRVGPLAYPSVHAEVARRAAVASLRTTNKEKQ